MTLEESKDRLGYEFRRIFEKVFSYNEDTILTKDQEELVIAIERLQNENNKLTSDKRRLGEAMVTLICNDN